VLVLAQRWVTGIAGGDQFDRPVVEALVIARASGADNATGDWRVYSAFYEPAMGQDLAQAFKWWDRGRWGLLPGLVSLSMEILSQWALPPTEIATLQQYCERLEALYKQAQTS
jgi:hypothetical protein